MAQAEVISFKPKLKLRCSSCGTMQDAACDCGVGYIAAGEFVTKAITENPELASMSDRAIAAEIGVHHSTVNEVRKRTVGNPTVGKRTGRDGKQRKKPKLTIVQPDPAKIVGKFFHELTDTLNDYCERLETFVEDNPDLSDECRAGLVQVLEVNSIRLQQLAQQIDDRENDHV